MPLLGEHRLGVELHALGGQLAVAQAHQHAAAARGLLEAVGQLARRRPASGSGRPSAARAGRGRSCGRRARSWWPCRAPGGFRLTSPPNAWASAWWPRHTPSVGTPASGRRRTTSSADAGLVGRARARARPRSARSHARAAPPTVARSLRTVSHLGAELAEVLDEVVGERVVVVEDEDPHGHSGCSQASAIARIAASRLRDRLLVLVRRAARPRPCRRPPARGRRRP